MKRIFFYAILLTVLLCRTPPVEGLTYDQNYYVANRAYLGSGNFNDPLFQLWGEIASSLDGTTGIPSLILTPGSAPSSPTEGQLYYDSASHGMLLYTGAAFVTIDTAGGTSLDGSYNLGSTIDVDGDAVTLTVSNTDNNRVLDLVQNDTTNNPAAMLITNSGTGSGLTFATTGTYDARGTSNTWSLTAAGSFLGVGGQIGNGDLTFTEPTTNDVYLLADADAQLTIGGTSKEDIDLNFATSNTLTLSSGTGTDTIAFGAVDSLTGVGAIAFDAAASSISLASSGDAQDLTIQVTGANNASLDLRSAGTGTDAIKVYATAGGIDIDSTDDMAITNTSTTDADDFVIEQVGANDASLIIQSAGTGGDAISLITSAATGDIKVNSGDMIDIDAADDILIDLAGAAGEDILITNTGGSITLSATEAAADAIVLSAGTAAGGIDITSNADIDITTTGEAGEDISITNTGGSIAISATENIAGAITIGVNGGAAETIAITATQSTSDAALDLNATAGGVDVDAAKSIVLTSTENTADSIVIQSTVGGIDIRADAATSEDIDISNTGGSVNITATEAAADAIVIDASDAAGGIDIDAGTNGINMLATGGDVTITNTTAKDIIIDAQAGRVLITGTESAADSIALVADGTNGEISLSAKVGGIDIDAASGDIKLDVSGATGDDITLTNTNGTGAGAIALVATAGGITATVADEKDLKIGNAGGDAYVIVSASATADNEDVRLVNTNGTNAKAIEILATAGGVSIEGCDEKEMYIGNNAADTYVKVAPSATPASEIISVVNAAGTADTAITLTATAGGITAKVADEKNLTLANAAADAYFIVAASATAGNEDLRVINTNGTNAKAIEILSSAGGVSIEGADSKEIYIGNDAADTYVKVAPSATPASELISVVNAAGTADTAIALTATAGGITAKVADEKNLTLANAAADAYFIVAASNTAGSEDLRMVNTNGTDAKAIEILASAGGISLECADGKEVYMGSDGADTYVKVAPHGTPATEIISVVNTAGTANGAIVLTSTAGGVDINAKEMFTVDVAAGTAATADITLTNTPGTDEAAIALIATAGGVDIDAAAAKNVDIAGGQVLISSKDAATSAIALTANVGAAETIVVTNTQGNTADAITLTAAAGGINIDAVTDIAVDMSGAGANFDVDSAAGSIYLDGGEAAANAIALQATNAAGGIDIDFGTGNMEVTGTGAGADFILDCDLFSIDGTGTANVTVTANGAGEDFTVAQGGAVDASLILSSAGTAADALQVTSTTGGMVLTTGLATGILINTATYEHKIKYYPFSQGVVAASEVFVGGGCGLICSGLDAGANEAGSTEGYVALGDDLDILIFSIPLPDDFVDTGTQADFIIEFDIDEQAAEQLDLDINIYEYDGTANATAIVTDTIVAANDGTRGWKGLVTNATGIGNEADLDQGDHLIISISPASDNDDTNIYGMRLTYRAGLQATQ